MEIGKKKFIAEYASKLSAAISYVMMKRIFSYRTLGRLELLKLLDAIGDSCDFSTKSRVVEENDVKGNKSSILCAIDNEKG